MDPDDSGDATESDGASTSDDVDDNLGGAGDSDDPVKTDGADNSDGADDSDGVDDLDGVDDATADAAGAVAPAVLEGKNTDDAGLSDLLRRGVGRTLRGESTLGEWNAALVGVPGAPGNPASPMESRRR